MERKEVSYEDLNKEKAMYQSALDVERIYLQYLGTSSGDPKYNYTQAQDPFEKIDKAERYAKVKAWTERKAVPYLENRLVRVQEQISNHQFSIAQSKLDNLRDFHAQGIISEEVLKEAEAALAEISVSVPIVVPGTYSTPAREETIPLVPGAKLKPLVENFLDPEIKDFDSVVKKSYADRLNGKSEEEQRRILRRAKYDAKTGLELFLPKVDYQNFFSPYPLIREVEHKLRSIPAFMALTKEERIILATREPGYEPLLAKVLALSSEIQPTALPTKIDIPEMFQVDLDEQTKSPEDEAKLPKILVDKDKKQVTYNGKVHQFNSGLLWEFFVRFSRYPLKEHTTQTITWMANQLGYTQENTSSQVIALLRSKFNDDPQNPTLIKRTGAHKHSKYTLNAEVEFVETAEDRFIKGTIAKINEQIKEDSEGKKYLELPNGQIYQGGLIELAILSAISLGTEQSPINNDLLAKAIYFEDFKKGISASDLKARVSTILTQMRTKSGNLGFEIVNKNRNQYHSVAEYYLKFPEPAKPQTVELSEEENIALQEARAAYEDLMNSDVPSPEERAHAIEAYGRLFGAEVTQ